MERDSQEYKEFADKYQAEKEYRATHPKEYPWWIYYQFGWHNMDYMTDEQKDEAVKFYRLFEHKGENGHPAYERIGRQPIFIRWCGDREVENEQSLEM